jgi:superfamily I DNA/RNA helicase
MNIHKSKGLEFSFIYMAGLYRNFNRRELEDDFGFNNKYGLYFPEDDKSKANIIQNLNKKYEIAQDTSEKVRLFYVMLTRTKEKMTLVMEVNGDFYTNAYIADSLSITQDFYLRHHIDEDNIDESKYYYIGLLALKEYFDKEINHYAFIQVSNKVQFTIPKEFNLLSLDEQYKYILSEIAKIEKA